MSSNRATLAASVIVLALTATPSLVVAQGSVTCSFVVDNFVDAVYYNGVDVTSSVIGDRLSTNAYAISKTITFDDVPHAPLEILGREETNALEAGCFISGLLMTCTGGSWDGFTSNTGALVQTYGSKSTITIEEARLATLTTPCVSRSGFWLTECPIDLGCTKIWPMNGYM
jgi:hypothetical protein